MCIRYSHVTNFFLFQLFIENLAGGAGITMNNICLGIPGIGYMVVQTKAFFRPIQEADKTAQTLPVSAVKADAQLVALLVRLMANSVKTIQIRKFGGSLLQIDSGPDGRIVGKKIIV